MMSKWRKKIALPLLFGFAIPVITMFCCCNGAIAAEKASPDHHHNEAEVDHHHANPIDSHSSACHHSKKSSHDHSECNHPQLIANLINNSVQFFAAQIASLQKISGDHFKELVFFQASVKPESSPPFLNTGPPGDHFLTTPLYLQLSVLRI
jgi:hypothetical protein